MSKNLTLQKHYNWMIFVYIAFLPLAMYPDGRSFNVALSKFVIQAIMAIIYIAFVFPKRGLHFLDTIEDKFLFGYFAWLCLSTIFAENIGLAILGSTARRDGLITFVFYMIAYAVGKNAVINRNVIRAVFISSVVISIYAIIQFFHLDPEFLQLYPDSWKGLAFSTMGNPNFLASYLVLVLPVGPYLAIKGKKWLALPGFAIVLFALFCTRTRGAWIGAVIGLITFLVLIVMRMEKKRAIALLLLIVLFSGAILVFFNYISGGVLFAKIHQTIVDIKRVKANSYDVRTVGTNRYYVWTKLIPLIKERPIVGYGVENMGTIMHQRYKTVIEKDFGKFLNWDKAHNEYLNILISSGIPSLILYLGFVISAIVKGVRKRRQGCEMIILFLSSVAGYLVQAFFNIQMVSVFYVFMAMLGILSSHHTCPNQADATLSKVD